MSKVKYRSFRKSEETLWRSSLPENEVEKPINWSNTPEGYYIMILIAIIIYLLYKQIEKY